MKTSKFKMTELGPIPEEWEVKRLGDCGAFIGGSVFPINRQGARTGDYPFFKVSDFSNIGNESVLRYGNNYVLKSIAHELHCTIIPNQAIVFAKIGAAIALERKRMVAQDSCIDNNMMAFCVNGSADTHYFVELLRRIKFADFTESTALPAINIRRLRDCLISVPPLPEQRRIAEVLSDVDALLSAMTTLIEKKRAIKQGAMQELLGMRNAKCGMRNVPRRRLTGFSGAWVEKRLGDCGSFSKGAGISRAQANSGRIPAVRYGELYTTHHEYIKTFESFISDDVARCSTKLTRGDIVFACSGETKEEIGKCAAFIGDEIAYAGGDLLILSPKEMYDSKFLAFELNTPFCASQKAAAGQGDAVVHILQRSLEELIVRIPPTLAEQQAIAVVLSDMDAEIAALEAKRAKYESIKQGMMQELLTGRTRLKGE